MGFFDDLGKKVTDAGQKTIQKTKELSDIARINSLISEEEKKINNSYHQIGELYVSMYANSCNGKFAGMVSAVIEAEHRIREYRKQIQDIKGVLRCEKCGAEVERGVAFCSACGTAMPRMSVTDNMEDYIKCDNCGNLVKRGMRFCTSCGKELNASESSKQEDELPKIELIEIHCSKCGAVQTGNSTFCIKCGAKLE